MTNMLSSVCYIHFTFQQKYVNGRPVDNSHLKYLLSNNEKINCFIFIGIYNYLPLLNELVINSLEHTSPARCRTIKL